jgi:hypothetical protein
MGTYQAADVYCRVEGWFGWAFFVVILLFQRAWYIITGISFADNRLWLAFLVIYGYWEEIYLNWLLLVLFREPRPRCSLIFDSTLESYRTPGLPSTEAQLSFSLSAFLLAQMILSKRYPNSYTTFALILLPFVVSGASYTLHNNTVWQIFVGAIIGILNALRRLLVFRYFAQEGLALIASNKIIQAFLPLNSSD